MAGRKTIARVGVLGAGAWGTALACAARRAGLEVMLWGRDASVLNAIAHSGKNPTYLPGIALIDGIGVTGDPADLKRSDLFLSVVPAQATADLLAQFSTHVSPETPIVLCAKGLDRKTGQPLSRALSTLFPDNPLAVLSGPSFASDVAAAKPTAVAAG